MLASSQPALRRRAEQGRRGEEEEGEVRVDGREKKLVSSVKGWQGLGKGLTKRVWGERVERLEGGEVVGQQAGGAV